MPLKERGSYLLLSLQLRPHLCSHLPPQRPLSFPIAPSSQRSPQLDERPAKLRRSCRAGRLRRAPTRCVSSNPTPFTGCMARRPLISGSHRPSPQQPAPSHCLHRHALTPPFFVLPTFFFYYYYTPLFFLLFFFVLFPVSGQTFLSVG